MNENRPNYLKDLNATFTQEEMQMLASLANDDPRGGAPFITTDEDHACHVRHIGLNWARELLIWEMTEHPTAEVRRDAFELFQKISHYWKPHPEDNAIGGYRWELRDDAHQKKLTLYPFMNEQMEEDMVQIQISEYQLPQDAEWFNIRLSQLQEMARTLQMLRNYQTV